MEQSPKPLIVSPKQFSDSDSYYNCKRHLKGAQENLRIASLNATSREVKEALSKAGDAIANIKFES